MVDTFQSKILEKKWLTKDVLLLSITVPESFDFKAGQYVMFNMTVDGVMKLKPYSILSPPSQKGQLDFCIKIIDGGHASESFKVLNVADELTVKGPFGHFVLQMDSQCDEYWFIGTGTGIVPLYSMILEHLPKFPNKTFRLIFGVRKKEGLFLHDELKNLEQRYLNFVFVPTLSQDAWEGGIGRVQAQLTGDLQKKEFYICGLKEMVIETEAFLREKGVPAHHIHFERYS